VITCFNDGYTILFFSTWLKLYQTMFEKKCMFQITLVPQLEMSQYRLELAHNKKTTIYVIDVK